MIFWQSGRLIVGKRMWSISGRIALAVKGNEIAKSDTMTRDVNVTVIVLRQEIREDHGQELLEGARTHSIQGDDLSRSATSCRNF